MSLFLEFFPPGEVSRNREGMASKLNDSSANAHGNRLGPMIRPEFLHNALDMGSHCFFGDKELFGNIPVASSTSEMTRRVSTSRVVSRSWL